MQYEASCADDGSGHPVDYGVGGICDDGGNGDGYQCLCNTGYTVNPAQNNGSACTDIDECANGNGGCAQTCTNTDGGFACSCNAGYILNADNQSCDDIDDCANAPCLNGGTCIDGVNTYTCNCTAGFDGNDCESPAVINYQNYTRRAGEAFTPVPASIGLPIDQCANQANVIDFAGTQLNADCYIPEDTCAVIKDSATVTCADGMMIDGMVWIQSDNAESLTLLVTDFIEVTDGGSLYVTGSNAQHEHAANAEIFLRNEYC